MTLPDNLGIVEVPIKSSQLMSIRELKEELYAHLAHDRFHTKTEVQNPLMVPTADVSPEMQSLITQGPGTMVFSRVSALLNNEREWLHREHVAVESLCDSCDGILRLDLMHVSEMPHGGLSCSVQEVMAPDVFGVERKHFVIDIYHSLLHWKVKYRRSDVQKFATEIAREGGVVIFAAHAGSSWTAASLQRYLDALLRNPWAALASNSCHSSAPCRTPVARLSRKTGELSMSHGCKNTCRAALAASSSSNAQTPSPA